MRLGVSSAQAARNNEGSAVATINGCGVTSAAGLTWVDDNATGTDRVWYAIAYAPELRRLVAVGSGGTLDQIMYGLPSDIAADQTLWYLVNSPSSTDWQDVCWSPEVKRFVAVGIGGACATSSSGGSWSSQSAGSNNHGAVCWSPERRTFVIVDTSGTGNRAMTSPDGVTWTPQTSAADNDWCSVCWSPELRLFVAVASAGASNRIMTSPDGVTWSLRAPPAVVAWRSVCWAPELRIFVAVGASAVMWSADGVTWTAATIAAQTWRSVCWSSEIRRFCAMSQDGGTQQAATSPDGLTWTLRTTGVTRTWNGIVWAAELRCFVAVCSNANDPPVRKSFVEKLQVMGTAANGTVAATLGSLGPTGAQTAIQGWLRVNINGTDRYIPFW